MKQGTKIKNARKDVWEGPITSLPQNQHLWLILHTPLHWLRAWFIQARWLTKYDPPPKPFFLWKQNQSYIFHLMCFLGFYIKWLWQQHSVGYGALKWGPRNVKEQTSCPGKEVAPSAPAGAAHRHWPKKWEWGGPLRGTEGKKEIRASVGFQRESRRHALVLRYCALSFILISLLFLP